MIGSLWLLLFLGSLLSLRNALPSFGWLSEINRNCGEYYLVFHLLALAVLLFRGVREKAPAAMRMVVLSTSIAMSCLYLDQLRPFLISPGLFTQAEARASLEEDIPVKALFANVCSENTDYQGIEELLQKYDPHIVALLEGTPLWRERNNALQGYPYEAFIPQVGTVGISLFSKWPLHEPLTDLGGDTRPIFSVRVEVAPGRYARIMTFDLLPPLSDEALASNKVLVKRVTTIARHVEEPLIVFSDMNATLFSNFYRTFLFGAKVRNAAYGFGLKRTWDTAASWVRFTIDHVFTKGGVRTASFDTVEIPGSDHHGIVVEFQVTGE